MWVCQSMVIGYWLTVIVQQNGESKLGRLVDALALGGEEGRDKLR